MIAVLALSAYEGMGANQAPGLAQPDAGAPADFDEWDVLPNHIHLI